MRAGLPRFLRRGDNVIIANHQLITMISAGGDAVTVIGLVTDHQYAGRIQKIKYH